MSKSKDNLGMKLNNLKKEHNKLFKSFKEDETPNVEELEEHCKQWRDLHRQARKKYKSRDSVGSDAVINAEAAWRRGTSLAALAEARYENESIGTETARSYVERAKEYLEESANIYDETSESKQVKGINGDIKSVNKFIAKLHRTDVAELLVQEEAEARQEVAEQRPDISSKRVSASQMKEINNRKRQGYMSEQLDVPQESFAQRHSGSKRQKSDNSIKPKGTLREILDKIESNNAQQQSGTMER